MAIQFRRYETIKSLDKYKQLMGIGKDGQHQAEKKTSRVTQYEKAYEVAADIRKFEIELFWKRATFFWAFITAIYVAYFQVLTQIHHNEHGYISLVILAALGLFFCVSWLLSSKGSKHWQENWEEHLNILEDNVTGPLYKTYLAEKSYSLSKIAIYAGWAVSFCAYGLLLYEFSCFVKQNLKSPQELQFILTIVFAAFVPLCLYVYSKNVLGNLSGTREITFYTHKVQ